MGLGSMCSKLLALLRKFFSLIIAIIMAVLTAVYVIGCGIVITRERNFAKSGFEYFLGIIVSIVTCICYIILHFVPRKAYRLLYALTGLFLLSMFLVGLSCGLSAPVITDCGVSDILDITNVTDLGNVFWGKDKDGANITIGRLGEPVRNCGPQRAVFAGAFINLVLYVIALFDVQSVLLSRIKSKTYGERFVEMGISN